MGKETEKQTPSHESSAKYRRLLLVAVALGALTSMGALAYFAGGTDNLNKRTPGITQEESRPTNTDAHSTPSSTSNSITPSGNQATVKRNGSLSALPSTIPPDGVPNTLFPVGRYRMPVFTSITGQEDIPYKSTYLTTYHINESDQYVLDDDLSQPTELKLNVYQPASDTLAKRPLIILAYGGGWTYGDREQRAEEAKDFAKLGYVAMTMDYTMMPAPLVIETPPDDQQLLYGGLFERGVHDIYDAYKYMVDHSEAFGVDETRIGVGGWSVGGLMAAAFGNTNATDTPYGIRAILPASSIFPSQISDAFGGWRTYSADYQPRNLFVSFADDEAQNGPYSPETDCAYLDSIGHPCQSILAPGNFHEIFFNLPPLKDPAIDFFATNVAGY